MARQLMDVNAFFSTFYQSSQKVSAETFTVVFGHALEQTSNTDYKKN